MSSNASAGLAGQTVQGSLYSVAASGVTLTLGLTRSVLLARLLLPEHFGVATLALVFLSFAAKLRNLGIDNALIHRKDVDEKVLATYFTMRMGLSLGSLGVLAGLTPLISRFYPDMPLLGAVLLAYVGISVIKGFNAVQVTILNKQLAFRHLAFTDVLSSVTMTIVAPYLAWRGWGVWSLVAEQFSGNFVRAIAIWVFYRPWRPRLGWDTKIARWFWDFGIQIWVSTNLTFLLDRFDDFWTGTFLGKTPLGYYSKAYEFAGYPRRVVANPVVSVFFPVFARLQDEPLRLARAFFRMTSLMLRVGFWFSLIFVLAAPEFIGLFIGERWLPMVVTFQLMIVYTLFDPLVSGVNSLLISIGQPGLIVRARIVQALIFIPGVIVLSSIVGIEGVALAADVMLLTGAVLLFRQSRRFVTYSIRALWMWPSIALVFAAGSVLALNPVWAIRPAWATLVGKAALITVLYWGVLLLTEREQLFTGGKMIWGLIQPRLGSTSM